MVKLSVIVINWNGIQYLNNCFSSIFSQSILPYEVIMFDNGSTDKSVSFVRKNFPKVKIINHKENIGFARPNNEGINNSKGDYVFLLNNDTKLDKECIKEIYNAIENENNTRVGMFSTKMLYFNERVDTLGIKINLLGFSKDVENESEINKVVCPCGGAAVYSKKMLKGIKMQNGDYYDSRYFAYYEDVDLGWRAKNLGWKCSYIRDAIVHHVHGATTKKGSDQSVYLGTRNRIWTFLKNVHGLKKALLILPFLASQKILIIKYALNGKAKLIMKAVYDGFFKY